MGISSNKATGKPAYAGGVSLNREVYPQGRAVALTKNNDSDQNDMIGQMLSTGLEILPACPYNFGVSRLGLGRGSVPVFITYY